jgi:hypothetical protein
MRFDVLLSKGGGINVICLGWNAPNLHEMEPLKSANGSAGF